jgi:hypothetical protein
MTQRNNNRETLLLTLGFILIVTALVLGKLYTDQVYRSTEMDLQSGEHFDGEED